MSAADSRRARYYYVVPGECRREIPAAHTGTPEARRAFAQAQPGATLIVRGSGAPSRMEFVIDEKL